VPFCGNCGHELSPVAIACPNCGHPGPAAGTAVVSTAASKRTEGFAIASLACGIAGFIGLPIVGSILAIVFGRAARKRIEQDSSLTGGDLARAGSIIGWVGLVLFLVLFLILMSAAFAHWTF